jgi:hypothetical protein
LLRCTIKRRDSGSSKFERAFDADMLAELHKPMFVLAREFKGQIFFLVAEDSDIEALWSPRIADAQV